MSKSLGVMLPKSIKPLPLGTFTATVHNLSVVKNMFVAEVGIGGETHYWVAKLPANPEGGISPSETAYLLNIRDLTKALDPQANLGPRYMADLTGPSQPAKGKKVQVRVEKRKALVKAHWSPFC